MLVLIRTKENPKVGIRCNFSSVGSSGVLFDGISSMGLKKLAVGDVARFEVIGMPSKVIFQAKIKKLEKGEVYCFVPKSLVSIERRAAARSATQRHIMGYMQLSSWAPNSEGTIGSPPLFDQFGTVKSWVPIFDISIGGVCLYTNFPDLLDHALGGEEDLESKLILPMTAPMVIPSTIRWQRRIKNRVNESGMDRIQMEYRLGVEFNALDEEQLMKIKQFIRQLSVADAI